MAISEITSIDDPRLQAYRNIRNRSWTSASGVFIVEGALLVERLLRSDYEVQSLLVDRRFEHRLTEFSISECELLLIEHELVEQLVGFDFHRGILGCGWRKPWLSIGQDFVNHDDSRETLLCTVGIQDVENLGGILRTSAALGIERVIIGPGTADPLSRRALRVAMGTTLNLKLFHSLDLVSDLQLLQREFGVSLVATSLQADSQSLHTVTRSAPTLILLGNERHGLPERIQALADQRVRIDMQLGTDSLNVGVAAGIIMHYLCRIASSPTTPHLA